ncbi:hypothetical protein QC762_0078060 [Podospora pseudocomata]|uniref:Uncharacterized protein n=1 Tax=Podospora pseudocomata TaxID=2093779 RepID=A0ABR0GB29_9PEZI|nr:hypothetical protein QC762_0078060 [Podospora pseudocomata]
MPRLGATRACPSLFVTGAAPASGARLFLAQWPGLTYYSMKMMVGWVPGWWYQWQASLLGLRLGSELIEEMKGNITWEVVRDMFPWILTFGLDDVRRLKVRTLHVAGGKGDDVGMMVRTAEALRGRRMEGGEDGSGGVVLREGVHGWDMQFPELFAGGVRAWVVTRGVSRLGTGSSTQYNNLLWPQGPCPLPFG